MSEMSGTMEEMIREIVKKEVARVASGPRGDKGRDGVLNADEVKNAVREVLEEQEKDMAVAIEDFFGQFEEVVTEATRTALDEKEKELMTKFKSMGRGGFVSGGFMDGNN